MSKNMKEGELRSKEKIERSKEIMFLTFFEAFSFFSFFLFVKQDSESQDGYGPHDRWSGVDDLNIFTPPQKSPVLLFKNSGWFLAPSARNHPFLNSKKSTFGGVKTLRERH